MEALISSKRLMSIDLMKGLGILLVAFYHTIEFMAEEGLYVFFWYGFGFFGAVLGVFFLVSGYFYKPGKSYGANVWHRVKNLLVPLLITMAVAGGIGFVAEWLITGEASAWTYLLNYGLRLIDTSSFLPYGDHGIDGSLANVFFVPCWFIVRLFFCNLLFYALVDFSLKKFQNFVLVVVGLLATATAYYYFVPVNFLFQLQVVLPCTALMLVGAYAAKHDFIGWLEHGKKNLLYWGGVAAVLVAFFFTSWYLYDYVGAELSAGMFSYENPRGLESIALWFVCTLTASSATLIICSWLAKIPYITKPILVCGESSALILCLHMVLSWIIVKCINTSYSIATAVSYAGEEALVTPVWAQAVACIGSVTLCCLIQAGLNLLKKAQNKRY